MERTSTSFVRLISNALRADYDAVVGQPLPSRWVALLHHLNERERIEREAQHGNEARHEHEGQLTRRRSA